MAPLRRQVIDLTNADDSLASEKNEPSQSTWKFPQKFSRSYSPLSTLKSETKTLSKADCRPPKRGSDGLQDDTEFPSKRRHLSVIEISSDTEEGYEQASSSSSHRSRTTSKSISIDNNPYGPGEVIEIDLEDEEGWLYAEEDIFVETLETSADSKSQKLIAKPHKDSVALRGAPTKFPWTSVPMIKHENMELRALLTVEMRDGDFMRIQTIVEHCFEGKVFIRGWRLRRTHKMEGLLQNKLNEVCYLFNVDLDDPRPILKQCIEEIPINKVLTIRELRETNQKFPACRFKPSEYHAMGKSWVYECSPLVVRSKYITTFASAKERADGKYTTRSLEFLSEGDCTKGLGICDEVRRKIFNQSIVAGGSSKAIKRHVKMLRGYILGIDEESTPSFLKHPQSSNQRQSQSSSSKAYSVSDDMNELSLDDRDPGLFYDLTSSSDDAFAVGGILRGSPVTLSRRCNRKAGQSYTYGDFFSGAGGASRGAILAGLEVIFGLDFWSLANTTYRKNFPNARVYEMLSDRFIMEMGNKNTQEFYVDILHISPPCQYWSPAHTRPGKDDERNMATLFSVMGLLTVVKPRITTLEQTFGLHTPHFRPYFNALVNMITSLGYSVTWSIKPLADWGLPQSRKRLLMIAAAPGEILPSFPPATHSKDGSNGLKKHVTINDTLKGIPYNAPDHDIESAVFAPSRFQPPYDGNSLAKTITTSGGQNNYHPSGRRDFTKRELACLQTFPLNHEFLGPCIKKQIGNAVPPKALGKVLFSHIRRHLEKFDGVVQESISIDD